MARKMISIRLEPELIQHVKNEADKNREQFTEYIEEALIKKSKFKVKKGNS